MLRAYVMLALSLFIGIMLIVDLYILAVYVNFKLVLTPKEKQMDLGQSQLEYLRRGLGESNSMNLTV